MKFKNGVREIKKKSAGMAERRAYWEGLNNEDKMLLLKAFCDQIYGGDIDHTEECIKNDFVLRGVGSTEFLNHILQLEKSGKPYLLHGGK